MLRPWVAVEVSQHLAVLEAATKPTIALHIRGGDKVAEDRQDEVRCMPCRVGVQNPNLSQTGLHISGGNKVGEDRQDDVHCMPCRISV